jgi:hypothetical protein
MFYQIQFNEMQHKINRRIAAMQTELIKYAASEKANPKAIEAKTDLIQEFNDYVEYNTRLYIEFREQQHTDFAAGFNTGYRKCRNEYEPQLVAKGLNQEQKRYDSITYAMQTQPDLF